jgi:hypothetical protein
VLAKIGGKEINSNLATAIGTVVMLVFAWAVAMLTYTQPLSAISRRTWIFLILSGLATGLDCPGRVISEPSNWEKPRVSLRSTSSAWSWPLRWP